MGRIMVLVVIAIAVVFGAGVIAGMVAMVAMAVRKEDRTHTLTGSPPNRVTQGVRRLTGVGVRDTPPPDDEQQGDPEDHEQDQPPWWEGRVD
jgi:hypothetical protein